MHSTHSMVVSIIIPAYNEAGTIGQVLDRVAGVPLELSREIIVVDDGSKDCTCSAVTEWMQQNPCIPTRLIRHDVNAGKGTAVRNGIQAATGHIILIQDADLEYQPSDYPLLLEPIVSGAALVVYGSRLAPRSRGQWVCRRQWIANRVLTALTNLLCRANLTDMETCYKAFRADVIKSLRLRAERFDIEPEITVKLLRAGYRIVEVPITYCGRTKQQGKKIKWHDGLHGIWAILKYRFAGNG